MFCQLDRIPTWLHKWKPALRRLLCLTPMGKMACLLCCLHINKRIRNCAFVCVCKRVRTNSFRTWKDQKTSHKTILYVCLYTAQVCLWWLFMAQWEQQRSWTIPVISSIDGSFSVCCFGWLETHRRELIWTVAFDSCLQTFVYTAHTHHASDGYIKTSH